MSRIAKDFNMDCGTAAEQNAIWESLVEMATWTRKGGFPKASRWFSWHECCEDFLPDFWASRMVLEWYVGGGEEGSMPTPESMSNVTFQKIRGDLGGLKLAYQCLSSDVFENSWLLYLSAQPSWTWYSHQTSSVKSPSDAVSYSVQMASHWASDSHLQDTAALLGSSNAHSWEALFEYTSDASGLANNILQYLVRLLGQRASSFAKHSCPPECFAGVLAGDESLGLSSDAQSRQVSLSAMKKMRQMSKLLWGVETSLASCSAQLSEDLRITFDTPTRLCAMCFEQSSWRPESQNGRNVLKSMLFCFSDTKIIEDIHQSLRGASGARKNQRMTPTSVQVTSQLSPVLEERGIPHPARIDRDEFLRRWPGTSPNVLKRGDFRAKSHKLPKFFSKILLPKSWTAMTETSLGRSAAAWSWVCYYSEAKLAQSGVRIQARDGHVVVSCLGSFMTHDSDVGS